MSDDSQRTRDKKERDRESLSLTSFSKTRGAVLAGVTSALVSSRTAKGSRIGLSLSATLTSSSRLGPAIAKLISWAYTTSTGLTADADAAVWRPGVGARYACSGTSMQLDEPPRAPRGPRRWRLATNKQPLPYVDPVVLPCDEDWRILDGNTTLRIILTPALQLPALGGAWTIRVVVAASPSMVQARSGGERWPGVLVDQSWRAEAVPPSGEVEVTLEEGQHVPPMLSVMVMLELTTPAVGLSLSAIGSTDPAAAGLSSPQETGSQVVPGLGLIRLTSDSARLRPSTAVPTQATMAVEAGPSAGAASIRESFQASSSLLPTVRPALLGGPPQLLAHLPVLCLPQHACQEVRQLFLKMLVAYGSPWEAQQDEFLPFARVS